MEGTPAVSGVGRIDPAYSRSTFRARLFGGNAQIVVRRFRRRNICSVRLSRRYRASGGLELRDFTFHPPRPGRNAR
jgi:hypothetical protein